VRLLVRLDGLRKTLQREYEEHPWSDNPSPENDMVLIASLPDIWDSNDHQ
jgi:hypothetical protein